jgi:hypothetical protein
MSSTKRGRRRKDEMRVPSALMRNDVDAMAKRRCLMLLSVLSGERSITQAITDAKIAAGTYYALEARALTAMLQALTPEATESGSTTSWQTISRLEARVKKLEIDKRRLERLLALTRRVVKAGPMKGGATRSRKSSMDKKIDGDQASTSTPAGGDGPSSGTESSPARTRG